MSQVDIANDTAFFEDCAALVGLISRRLFIAARFLFEAVTRYWADLAVRLLGNLPRKESA